MKRRNLGKKKTKIKTKSHIERMSEMRLDPNHSNFKIQYEKKLFYMPFNLDSW